MHDTAFDTLIRRAGAPGNRRTSLKALGAAAVLTAAAPGLAHAGKAGKKAKKKCKKQVGACRQAFDESICSGSPDEEACRREAAECCAFLKTCKAGPAIECVLTKFID